MADAGQEISLCACVCVCGEGERRRGGAGGCQGDTKPPG